MIRFFRKLFRGTRKVQNRFEYALIYHKVSRRLGVARAMNRQLRNENEFLRDFYMKHRRDLAKPVIDIQTKKSDSKVA